MPLGSIWTPRRDSRGLFVPHPRIRQQPTGFAGYGVPSQAYMYSVSGENGLYYSITDKIYRTSNAEFAGTYQTIYTPFGAGMNPQKGYSVNNVAAWGGGLSILKQTYISLFYLYNASKTVANYPRLFGGIGNNPSNRLNVISWINTAGEQSIVITPDLGFGGVETSISGIQNGLHCVVMSNIYGGAGGVTVYLDGQYVTSTTSSTGGWNSGTFPKIDFFGESISKGGVDVATILFQGAIYNTILTADQLAALSGNPYPYFFINAPNSSVKNKLLKTFALQSPLKHRLSNTGILYTNTLFDEYSLSVGSGNTRFSTSNIQSLGLDEVTYQGEQKTAMRIGKNGTIYVTGSFDEVSGIS